MTGQGVRWNVPATTFLPMPRAAVTVRSTFSGVQQGGVPQRVFALQNEDWEYQVYQTAALLAAR